MTVVIADGQEVELNEKTGITCMVAPGDMVIEVPTRYLIDPEKTVETAKNLSDAEWADLLGSSNFLKMYRELWKNDPPKDLKKSAIGVRHSVGMILMLCMARCNGLKSHLVLPETYLHPTQVQRLMSMIYLVTGAKSTFD